MGTSVTEQKPSGGTPIPRSSQSEQTPPTPNPAAPPTNEQVNTSPANAGAGVPKEELERAKKLIEQQEQVLRDYAKQNTELTQRLRGMDERVSKIENPPASKEEQNQEFWKDPAGFMQRLVREELNKTVEPLNRSVQETAYDRMKAEIKKQYADVWDKIEAGVDQFVANAVSQGVALNAELLNVAALTNIGIQSRTGGLTPTPAPNPAPTPTPTTPAPIPGAAPVNPPYMRPSSPGIPGAPTNEVESRQLTENERRLARERGMTEAQYLDWLEVPSAAVVHSKIGKQEEKK